jgi:methyltransferase, FkbM family
MERQVELTKEELTKRLNPHLLNLVTLHDVEKVEYKHPIELIGNRRFDIIAKYLYAKYKKLGVQSNWAELLYMNHIYAFNGGIEEDGSGKDSVRDFLVNFDELLDSIARNGFDYDKSVVPIGVHGEPLDGAHRVAACLQYELKVPVVRLNYSCRYDYRYFMSRGLDRQWCDPVALELAQLCTDSYVVTVFPSAQGKEQELVELIEMYGDICYRKDVTLNRTGALNLIKVMYKGEPWLGGWANNFAGAKGKADPCFQKDGPVRVFLIRASDPDRLVLLKKQIRELFGIGNHSVHINDRHEETIRLAQTFFNDNSIHFLNYSKVDRRFGKFIDLHERYKLWLERSGLPMDYFCVDSSAVLGAYGIREPNDLDFICFGDQVQPGYVDVSNHEAELIYHVKPKDEIIFNPAYHFYYDGVKYASIAIVKGMKNKRSEGKDAMDVQLIDHFFEQDMIMMDGDAVSDLSTDALIGKKIVLFGASAKGIETASKLGQPVAYYVDNDSRKWGTSFNDAIVEGPHKLLEEDPEKIAIIISSMYVREISQQLQEMGFERNRHYWESLFDAGGGGSFIRKVAYFGYNLYYSRGTSLIKRLLEEGYYEQELCERIVQELQTVDHPIFVDVGCNVGLISLYVASQIPAATIYAFEPGPHQFQMMKYTLLDNKLNERIHLFNEAAGREPGEHTFFVHRTEDASGDGFMDTGRAGDAKKITVKVTTLDRWWEQCGRPNVNVVKIDTEGAEFWVLAGGEKMISTCRPTIYFELWPQNIVKYPYTADNIMNWFENFGYEVRTLSGNVVTINNLDRYFGVEDTFVGYPK